MFYIGLYRENKIFSCRKLLGQRALILCMKHHLVNLYQVCSNYAPGGQKVSYVLLIQSNFDGSNSSGPLCEFDPSMCSSDT